MATTAKAHDLAAELASILEQRLSLDVVASNDSDENPVLTIGDNGAGDPGAVIKLKPQDWPLAKDILGLTANIFTPHVIMVCLEANQAGAVAEADINGWDILLPILGEVVLKGCRVEIYESANATPPAVAEMVEANLKATFDPSLYHGMIANQ